MSVSLVYSIDRRNENAMLVSLSSALEQSPGLARVVVLYSDGLSDRLTRRVAEVCGSVPFEIVDTAREFRRIEAEGFQIGTVGKIAYLKFLVPEVVDTTRAVFLDADTIVRTDLREIYETELAGMPIGAVQDWLVPTVLAPNSPVRRYVAVAGDLPYFNSGVMLIDVPRLREVNLMEQAVRLRDVEVRYADQDLFNLMLLARWQPLDPRWNYPVDRSLVAESRREEHEAMWDDRKISHYMGRKKPWIFPFNTWAVHRDFVRCRQRSPLRYWIPTPLNPASLRYYRGYVGRKLGVEI